MQVEIDFEVFKALTAMRESEADSYNSVIRRLLRLPTQNALAGAMEPSSVGHRNALAGYASPTPSYSNVLMSLGGVWFDNIHFPEGTQFRATYKGQTYIAEVNSGRWVGGDGIARTSPSAAASAISKTNVNGWRFWYFKRPDDSDWVRMDHLKS